MTAALAVISGADEMIVEKPADLFKLVLEEIRLGRDELKDLIKSEIRELKDEHIADLKEELRRAWDAIRTLEKREAERRGGFRAWHAVWGAFGTLVGAAAVIFSGYLTKGH
jgi:hypothetical protein